MIRWLNRQKTEFLSFISSAGAIFVMFWQAIRWSSIMPLRKKEIIDQLNKIGVMSCPIVSLTAIFTGMVLALQSAYSLRSFQAEMYVSGLVAVAMARELGPVLTALAVAGRVGASITAELGTMKVTEQIDALETLATNPVSYLVTPRLLAGIIMLPVLTMYSNILGIIGGYLVGVFKLGISSDMYLRMTWNTLLFKDVYTGLIKSLFFGIIIIVVGCYQGFRAKGGAEGVGEATTVSVVTSFVLIIVTDCLFTALFYFVF
jgi:phospholipid/cholesterol/gamma-HCH transport system permease protein